MNLILFTSIYPFDGGAERTFLDPEIVHLNRVFDRVILVPKKVVGNCLPLPERVSVDTSYADTLKTPNLFLMVCRVFGSSRIYREIESRPTLLCDPRGIEKMIRFLAVALLTFDWVDAWLHKNGSGEKNIFYTYWFDSSSFGIGLAKRQHPGLRVISRAHGYDIYEEEYYGSPYWPFRRDALALMDALYPDSDAGLGYLAEKYDDHSSIMHTDRLGVAPPGFRTPQSTDGIFRIVSCSRLVAVKRVDLLLEGVLRAALKRPEQKFEWTHMGNGDTRDDLQRYANEKFPPNATANLAGYSTLTDLMEFYRNTPLDVFINVSITEGTPVAIMEAVSCGIPIIATAVGGNPEIVLEENGLLLDPNPVPEEIADALLVLVDNPEMAARMRQESYNVWRTKYNADENFRRFAERIRSGGEK